MRAVVLRGGRLEVRETDDPVPGPGDLLLRTLSTAICASDVHFMDHPSAVPDDGSGRFLYDEHRDLVLGHEFVGEVIAHGPDCTDQFPVGTRVTAMPVRLVDAFAVGEFYVRSARLGEGEIPIVIGAGAIGLSAVAALTARGIEPIIVSDYQPDRLALARDFGAHIVVNPAERSPFEVWREVASERGVTTPAVVFECVGAAGLVQHIVESCEMGTRIFAAGGWYTGDQLSCTAATHKGVTIQFGGGPHPEDWYGTLDAVCDGSLDPLPSVGMVIGLDEVPEAIDLSRKAEGPPRIVVHPNG